MVRFDTMNATGPGRGRYGIEDTRRVLLEALRVGIRPFCLTVDREAREYLPHLYGAARYTVVEDVARPTIAQLAGPVQQMFRLRA